MFAVVAHFDQKTEQAINTIWKGLSASSISDYAYEISGRKPHITIADYQNNSTYRAPHKVS